MPSAQPGQHHRGAPDGIVSNATSPRDETSKNRHHRQISLDAKPQPRGDTAHTGSLFATTPVSDRNAQPDGFRLRRSAAAGAAAETSPATVRERHGSGNRLFASADQVERVPDCPRAARNRSERHQLSGHIGESSRSSTGSRLAAVVATNIRQSSHREVALQRSGIADRTSHSPSRGASTAADNENWQQYYARRFIGILFVTVLTDGTRVPHKDN